MTARKNLVQQVFRHGWKAVLFAAILFAMGLGANTFTPAAHAQVAIRIGPPPVCPYGYYDYAPYACAPRGFYGPGYFYNGIFLGVGPWRNWGYGHGWGRHRFVGPGGGRYYPHHRYYHRPPHREYHHRGHDYHGHHH